MFNYAPLPFYKHNLSVHLMRFHNPLERSESVRERSYGEIMEASLAYILTFSYLR